MYQPINEASYKMSLQNIQCHSQHVHFGIEILLVIRGQIQVTVNQYTYHLSENDLLLINANHVHSIIGDKENVVLSLQIPLSLIKQYYQNIDECRFECNSSKGDKGLYMLFDRIRQILAEIIIVHYQKQDGNEVEIISLIYRLFTLLIRNFKSTHLGKPKLDELEDKRISEILVFIEKNYRKPLSLEAIAKQHFLSLYYLSRYFKQTVGVSFSQYLKQVRLDAAVHELVFTNHPIMHIALNNGFPSAKSFNKAFKEVYNQTPVEYRSLHKIEESNFAGINSSGEQYTSVNSPNVLLELSKYITQKDSQLNNKESVTSTVHIDLPKNPIYEMKKTSRLLVIGQLDHALRENSQAEMKMIQELLHFDYVYFTNLFSQSILKNIPLMQNGGQFYYIDSLFSLFQQLKLIPFISVDFEKEIAGNAEYFDRLNEFLQHSVQIFGKEFVDKWHFELICSEWDLNNNQLFSHAYHLFYQTVKKTTHAKVGFHIPFSLEKGLSSSTADFLMKHQKECDLICFIANPNENLNFSDMNNRSFEMAKEYLKNTCIQLKMHLKSAGLTNVSTYLTNWNTLYGNTTSLSGSFFRSAIIFKSILDVMREISGLGFWINTGLLENNKSFNENIEMNGIALFYYYQIKRPVFFNIQLALKLGLQVLSEGEDFLLTKSEQGYQLVIYNSSYVNPAYSVENFFLRSLTIEKKIVISDLPAGDYQIRKHILDRDNGAVYMNWMNLASQNINDQEIITFLKQRTYPNLQIYEEHIVTECSFLSTLTSNAVHLFEIRPLNKN